MKRDYTMDDFRNEMQRRGMYEDAYPDRLKGARTAPTQPPRTAKKKVHGGAIIKVVPYGVHPLHSVKVRASGARSGCPIARCRSRRCAARVPAPRPAGMRR